MAVKQFVSNGSASGFRAYPPGERCAGDAAAYNKSDVRQRLAFCTTSTEVGMFDVVACIAPLDCLGPDSRLQQHVPTSLLTKWVWSALGYWPQHQDPPLTRVGMRENLRRTRPGLRQDDRREQKKGSR